MACTELQYGVNVARQEIEYCPPNDALGQVLKISCLFSSLLFIVDNIFEFVAEVEPEFDQLQDEVSTWETVVTKVLCNASYLLVT